MIQRTQNTAFTGTSDTKLEKACKSSGEKGQKKIVNQ